MWPSAVTGRCDAEAWVEARGGAVEIHVGRYSTTLGVPFTLADFEEAVADTINEGDNELDDEAELDYQLGGEDG